VKSVRTILVPAQKLLWQHTSGIIHEHLAFSYGVGRVGDRMSDIIVRHGEDGDERSASLSSSVMSCLSVATFCKRCAADARTKVPDMHSSSAATACTVARMLESYSAFSAARAAASSSRSAEAFKEKILPSIITPGAASNEINRWG
jgi:hypothetical protein